MQDEEIIHQLTNGDVNVGLTSLMKKYQNALYQQIRRMLVDHDDTNDVLQMVFIKIWKNIDSYRGDSKLYTWICRIAINESLTFIESKKKKAGLRIDDGKVQIKDEADPYTGITGDLIQKKLILAIQELPEKQRAVFNLKYFEEMPYEEISSITGTSVGALKASYHHAVQKIEKYIQEH